MRGCLRRMSTPDAARMFASVDAVPAFEEHGGRVRVVSFGVVLRLPVGTLNIYYCVTFYAGCVWAAGSVLGQISNRVEARGLCVCRVS